MTNTNARNGSHRPILLCTGTYFRGGISSWAVRFIRAARVAGADVRLVLPWIDHPGFRDPRSFTMLDQAADLAEDESTIRLRLPRSALLANRPRRQQELARALAPHARGATLLLNYDWDLFGACAELTMAAEPIRVVNVVHSDDEVYYAVAAYYAPMVGGTVAVSSSVARELERRRVAGEGSDAPDAPLAVIPCGVDMPPRLEREPFEGRLRLVTACRLDERQKRVSDIPRIASALRARGVPFDWVVLGDGPERASLEETIAGHDLSAHVRIAGWRPHGEVLLTFRRSDVYVQTSAFEGTPVSVMEAMASGVVPVVTSVSGTEELLGPTDSQRAGVALDVGDVDGFAGVLGALHASPEHITELSRRAERRARTVLSTETTTAAMLALVAALPDRPARWPADRSPAIPLALVGDREARLDCLPNPVAVAARSLIRLAR